MFYASVNTVECWGWGTDVKSVSLSCYVTLCYALLRHVMLNDIVLCLFVMSCCAMFVLL